MKRLFLFTLAVTALLPGLVFAGAPVKKVELKVLYVGGTSNIETAGGRETGGAEAVEASIAERMRSFESLLNDYFTSVTVVRDRDYTQAMSDDYDVTVMDGLPKPIVPGIQDRKKGIYLQAGYLTEDFDRPMVTIANVSDRIGRRIGTKHDWYCLCLLSNALHWRAEHPIFHGPFDVTMTVIDKPTPDGIYDYAYHFEGNIVPDKLPMWQVQTIDYSVGGDPRIGMVARPGGYEDSPEAEYISGGQSAKSPDAVAIGRHGNFLHWGFAASPANMTEEAKPVFANAIVYISKFAGQTPIARKYNDRAATRSYATERKYFLSYQAYERFAKMSAERDEMMNAAKEDAERKQARGETLDASETAALSFKPSPRQTYEQHLQSVGRQLYSVFGTDTEAYNRYFDENYDYFVADGYGLAIDEDAKSLGIPNNDKRILDAAITMLETGENTEMGKRILARYTLVDFPTAAQWREWYDKYEDLLFFTESGGWVFLVNSREPGVNDYKGYKQRRSAERIAPGVTSDAEPVAIAAEARVQQDGRLMLTIKVVIHPGYHIYDNMAPGDVFTPTVVEVGLPEGYSALGDLKRPSGLFFNQSGTTIYRDTVIFTQEFTGEGNGELKCTVTYQCCDRNICFPPETKEFTIAL